MGTLSHPGSDVHLHSGTGLDRVSANALSAIQRPTAQPKVATPPVAGALRPARNVPDTGDEGFQVPGGASL